MGRSLYSEAQRTLVAAFTKARKRSGLLQADLAGKLGKDQSFISNIERGQRRIDVIELYALARAMEIDPVDLYRELTSELPYNVEI